MSTLGMDRDRPPHGIRVRGASTSGTQICHTALPKAPKGLAQKGTLGMEVKQVMPLGIGRMGQTGDAVGQGQADQAVLCEKGAWTDAVRSTTPRRDRGSVGRRKQTVAT